MFDGGGDPKPYRDVSREAEVKDTRATFLCLPPSPRLSDRMPRRHGGFGEVSVFEVITSYSDISPTQLLVATACVVAVADIGCAIALYGEIHGWAARSWWPLVILKNTWDAEVRGGAARWNAQTS